MKRFRIEYFETRVLSAVVSFDEAMLVDGAPTEDELRRALGGIGLIAEVGNQTEDYTKMIRIAKKVTAL